MTSSIFNLTNTCCLQRSTTLTSAVALTIGLTAFTPAFAQEAVVIADGEVVTDQQVLDGDGDSLTIDAGGTLQVEGDSSSDAVSATGNDIIFENTGTIATSGDGIQSDGANAQITNSGNITSDQADGLDSNGDNALLTNSGNIVAENEGIESDGNNAQITNSGSITSIGEEGIDSDGDNDQIVNSGRITAGGDGIEADGNNVRITNSGSIAAGTEGIEANGDDAQITNSGSIVADSEGIDSSGDNVQITNSGTIQADDNGIEASGINAVVVNSGQVFVTAEGDAAVEITGEGSALTNTGLLSSTGPTGFAILGGTGAQTVTLGAGSQLIGAIDLGDGEDTLNIEAGNASAVLAVTGVETVNTADGLGVIQTADSVVTVDTTTLSVLNEAANALSNDAHAQIAGRFAPAVDLATQGTPAVTSGAWASLFGQARSVGDDGAALAYSHDFAGVMAGYDRDISLGRVGFVGGVATGEIATDIASQNTTSESLFAGAYLNQTVGRFDLTSSLMAGVNSYDSERLVFDNLLGEETATASFDSQFVSASVNAKAQAFMLGNVALVPSVTATYTATSFDAYTEDGTTNANLEIGSRTAQALSGRAQLASRYLLGNVDTQFRGGIDARASSEDDITATLDGTTVDFATADSDSFVGGFVGARAVFSQSEAFSVVGDVEVQFGERETRAVAAGLNVSFSF